MTLFSKTVRLCVSSANKILKEEPSVIRTGRDHFTGNYYEFDDEKPEPVSSKAAEAPGQVSNWGFSENLQVLPKESIAAAEAPRGKLGFVIDEGKILHFDVGGCRPATNPEIKLWYELQKLTAPAAPSERADQSIPWNPEIERVRKEMMRRFSDDLTMEKIASFAYETFATPSMSEEREMFKRWAKDKNWYHPPIFAYGEKEGRFSDALMQELWEVWQARAGLSSQEGK